MLGLYIYLLIGLGMFGTALLNMSEEVSTAIKTSWEKNKFGTAVGMFITVLFYSLLWPMIFALVITAYLLGPSENEN